MHIERYLLPGRSHRERRSGFWRYSALALILLSHLQARADDVSVPIELQVDLLGRVAKFERTFASKGTTPATVLVVTKAGVTASTRAGAQINAALLRSANWAGRPLAIAAHAFTNAAALKAAATSAAIVYLTPGLSDEVKNIAQALSAMHILVVASANGDVERGAVLGFELESARPKIVINLSQARGQSLDFNAQLLRLSKVIK